ncbi:spleen trypsin inhibitor I [Rhinolophus sinicus]|uniref:spleen trypsin inhibitor I n=1 Tax=Rhinolophus sinicus TaxID=89399 RepID=UPI003D78EDE9
MDPLCLSAALLFLFNIQAAGAQGSDTVPPSQRRPVFCLEPPYKGPGKAVLPRFFFNTRSGFCEAFVFGGGKAKLNNFLTKDECASVCSGRKPALQTQYRLELQAPPELKDEPGDEPQHQGPACRNLAPENQDEDDDQKPEDEDSDLKEDDEHEDEDEVNDEDGNEEAQD